MKIGNIIINKKIIMLIIVIFMVATSLVGYSYINSDLNSTSSITINKYNCNQTNLYDRISCMSVMDNTKSKYVTSNMGIDFSNISSDTNGKGIYTLASSVGDEYPIHYYRGDVSDNNVKFSGFCWKIVRTTDTGGTKLLYNGEIDSNGNCTDRGSVDTVIGTSPFNSLDNSISYVGYTYNLVDKIHQNSIVDGYLYASSYNYTDGVGFELVNPTDDITTVNTNYYTCRNTTGTCDEISFITRTSDTAIFNVHFLEEMTIEEFILNSKGNTSNSTIKDIVDSWYINNILSTSDSYLEDTTYCGDRTMNTFGSDSSFINNGWSSFNSNKSNNVYYRNYGLLEISTSPQVSCLEKIDNYTVSDEIKGNGYLDYKSGLISIDEVILAGGGNLANSSYYLVSGNDYWTMSPRGVNRADVRLYRIKADGSMSGDVVSSSYGVRPVVSLNNSVNILSGDGSEAKPFVIS